MARLLDRYQAGDLATRSGIQRKSVKYLVEDLIASGYVSRVVDPADARARIVRPTERGVKARRALYAASLGVDAAWARSVGDVDSATTRRALRHLAALVQKPRGAGRPS